MVLYFSELPLTGTGPSTIYAGKSPDFIMMKNREEKTTKSYSANLPKTTNSLESYIADISNYPVLSRKEEYELAMRYKTEGDIEAARQLVSCNLKFVVKIAHEYRNYGINIMDIIQEGNIGLMQAVKGFDPTKGYKLISYAVWWIRAYIHNFLIQSWSLVKVGTNQAQRKLFYKLRSTKNALGTKTGAVTDVDYSEIADQLGVKVKDVVTMDQRMTQKDLSLDAKMRDDQKVSFINYLKDERYNQEDLIAKSQIESTIRENIDEILSSLKEREKYVVKHHVISDDPMTLEEIGRKYGISRERVRQIKTAALHKIRKALSKQGIKDPGL